MQQGFLRCQGMKGTVKKPISLSLGRANHRLWFDVRRSVRRQDHGQRRLGTPRPQRRRSRSRERHCEVREGAVDSKRIRRLHIFCLQRRWIRLLRLDAGEEAECGSYSEACSELKRWVYAGGRFFPGLVEQREPKFQMCMGGEK